MARPTAIVYIDGLNLQRRLIDKVEGDFWVDPQLLVETMLLDYEVLLVRLFTARNNVVHPAVQDKYWARLELTSPKLRIEFGRLKTTIRLYPTHANAGGQSERQLVKVRKIEEKGSDVALGAYMVFDASHKKADVYVLLSSDSDFEPALRLIRNTLQAKFGLLIPNARLPKLFAPLQPEFVRYLDSGDVLAAKFKL